MLTNSLSMSNDFSVTVETTDNRGFTPEEVAVRCVNRIIGISDNAHLLLETKLTLTEKN